MFDLRGRVYLITGASSGLGEATARLLAAMGASVALAARRRDLGDAVRKDITEAGGRAIFVATDVCDAEAVDALVARTFDTFGRLDGAVNNAGVSRARGTPTAELADEDWHTVIDTNLSAVWRCMKAEIPAILAGGGGSIVNVASIYGLVGSDVGHAAYCASKFGLIGLTKSAAIDYAQQGLRVNAVCPGFCHSEMIDPGLETMPDFMASVIARHSAMDRLGQASEVAQAIVWLLSDAASFVNGAALPVDGGPATRLY